MRFAVMSLTLALSAGAALAQTGSITPAPGTAAAGPVAKASAQAKAATRKKAVAEAKADCMRLWDAGTHMSKQQWSSTCDRIQTRLDNLKVENLDVMGTGVRKKTGGGKQGRIDFPGRVG
jgi:hypothetical protein